MHTPDSDPDDTIENLLTASLSMLKVYAFRLTGDTSRADDLLQDTTVKVLLNSKSYVYNSNFNGWVSTIMYNLFLNSEKRSGRTAVVSDATLFEREYFDCYVDAREIKCAINRLPLDYCKAFLLYADGYKYHEIAARLNIPIGTVKSRIHTARAKLQQTLRDYVG